ncbi:MAG: phosphate permease [Legionellales bacterium]|nr:phosphate permease [Legionellales bacterium]
MELNTVFLILGCTFGFVMAWGLGANDVSNAMGTSVGSGAISLRQAIVIAIIFEFLGAFLVGGEVTNTIRRGIIDPSLLANEPNTLVVGMLASLFATGLWLVIATHFGWPVSTTHTIVGAVVGFGAIGISFQAVQWSAILPISLGWIFSPLLGGILAYLLFTSVQRLILDTPSPLLNAIRLLPIYVFLTALICVSITLHAGLPNLNIHLPFLSAQLLAVGISIVIALLSMLKVRFIKFDEKADLHFHYANVERVFSLLMIFTACAMAFAHGSNDVANAIGPLSAVVSIVDTGEVTQATTIPQWVLLLGASGIVAGLLMYGHRVIATIGEGITQLTPTRGFSATLAAATTVVMASGTGLPISTTHTLVGAILGVGLARGMDALNLTVIRNIFMSWVVTLPAGVILSVLTFWTLKWCLL